MGTFTWNLGTLGEWVLELLRSAPKPLLWLKTPKHSAVGEKLCFPISKSFFFVKYNYNIAKNWISKFPLNTKLKSLIIKTSFSDFKIN